jgi:hypothetical protein
MCEIWAYQIVSVSIIRFTGSKIFVLDSSLLFALRLIQCRYFREKLDEHGGNVDTPGPAQFAAVAESRRWPRPAVAQAGAPDGIIQIENSEIPDAGIGGAALNSIRNRWNWQASGAGVPNHPASGSWPSSDVNAKGTTKTRSRSDLAKLTSESPVRAWDEPHTTKMNKESESKASYKPESMQQQGAEVVVDSVLNSRADVIRDTSVQFYSDAITGRNAQEEVQENVADSREMLPAEERDEVHSYRDNAAKAVKGTKTFSPELLPAGWNADKLAPEENLEVVSRVHEWPLGESSTMLLGNASKR